MYGPSDSDCSTLESDDSGSVPVLGDILMVGVAVIFMIVAAIVVLDLVGILPGEETTATVEFEFEDDADPSQVDSFGRTNENGTYDGLLTIRHTYGTVIPADEIRIRGVSTLEGRVSLLETAGAGDSPSYEAGDEFGAGDRVTVWVRSEDTVHFIHDRPNEGERLLDTWEL